MKQAFQKMMRDQVQADLNNLTDLALKPAPKSGWIKVIRQALGMSSYQLAQRCGCTQANVTAFERREQAGTISLKTLDQVAKAMNCRLVYFLVPNKPLEQLLEDQARLIAQKRIRSVGHSMDLEQQGLSAQQKQQQEKDLIQELLQDSPRKLWGDKNDV